jgi:FAD/FMN-containing dehydrogenase
MFDRTIKNGAIQHFKAHLYGELISPGDDGYENARRVWNGAIDKYPALIVRCADVSDVVSAVQFARAQELHVAVRGGGHSFSGNGTCDGGLVIDLSPMKRVQVDRVQRIAWAQAGLTLGEFVRETQAFGLATPVGNVSTTGLAGLTLGGGIGWLMGEFGLTIDNLLAVEIVTAQGQVLTASAVEHADLFWGVRGGGGNFGIVTSFKFQLHPVGPLVMGMVVHPLERAREVLHLYRDITSTAPDAMTTTAGFVSTPGGLPAVALAFCYCGSLEDGEQLAKPIRTFGSPVINQFGPMPYSGVISIADTVNPAGRLYYSKTRSFQQLSDELIETLIEYSQNRTSPFSQMMFQHVHGAVCRVDATDTAFALREEHYALHLTAAWEEGEASPHIAWLRDCWRALERLATGEAYLNFMDDPGEEPALVQTAYGANYKRLVALKNRYDPGNFFHINQNLKPTVQR